MWATPRNGTLSRSMGISMRAIVPLCTRMAVARSRLRPSREICKACRLRLPWKPKNSRNNERSHKFAFYASLDGGELGGNSGEVRNGHTQWVRYGFVLSAYKRCRTFGSPVTQL